jgi:hypothetical protein
MAAAQQQAPPDAGDAGDAGGAGAQASSGGAQKDDVVDAEFEEVKDQDRKS